MKIGILGAGTLGKFLAGTFCTDKHDVTVIDTSSETLTRIRDKFDVMAVVGDGAKFETLREAQAGSWDMFIAAGSSDTVNMHACMVARHLGVTHTICRLINHEYFSEDDDFTPASLGIDHVVIPEEECVRKIIDVLDNPSTLEKITFSIPEALISAFKVLPGSLLAGLRLDRFPEPEMIRGVRFSGVVRHGELFAPHGETELQVGDEVYLGGKRDAVNAMVDWANPDKKPMRRVILTGRTKTAMLLAEKLPEMGFDTRLIEKEHAHAEQILDELNRKMILINGDPNDSDVLNEAGVSACDVFIAVGEDDEENILSCILAKRMGAKKVITLTNKEEYLDLVCKMEIVNCGFSRWLVSGNSVLRYISTINRVHTNAILHRTNAYVSEYVISDHSRVCNRQIDSCNFPVSTVLSLLFRGDEVITPDGELTILPGDCVALISTEESEKRLEKLFN